MTDRQLVTIGAIALLLLLARRNVEASIEGGAVLDMRRAGEPDGSGVSSEAGCVCADPKPGIYVSCSCDDPSVVASSSGY